MRNSIIIYDAMCTAIADCHRIDEVKDLRDKAMALELYAKQAKNFEAERKASEIRLRAERRTGELLLALKREDQEKNAVIAEKSNCSSQWHECLLSRPKEKTAKSAIDTMR